MTWPASQRAAPRDAAPSGSFERATRVAELGDGRFTAEVDPGWSAPTAANGGYLAAILVRAIQAAADPSGARQLRSLTCHFLRPATAGPMEVQVEVLRAGRRISTVRVEARQEGRGVVTGLAALAAADLPAAGTWLPPMPAVAPAPLREAASLAPERYRHDNGTHWLAAAPGMPPMFHQVKVAPRFGGIPFSGRALPAGAAPEAGGWVTLPEPRPLDAAFVALCSDVFWPPAFEVLDRPALAPTIDLTIHVRADLPPEGLPDQPVLGWFRSTTARGGLVEEDGTLFLGDGTLLAHARQLAILMPLG